MKKTKKIILSIIVSLIALISIFSCVKGKYTPEPILSPVSVLKPVNSKNENVLTNTGTYQYIYFNSSESKDIVNTVINDITLDYGWPFITQTYNVFFYTDKEVVQDIPDITAFLYLGYDIPNNYYEITYWYSTGTQQIYNSTDGWLISVLDMGEEITGVSSFNFDGNTLEVGTHNNLLTNLISPVPFLFEGDINYEQSSTGFEDVTQVESLYINTNYNNETLKTLIDEKVGYNDISFSLSNENTTHTIRINNTTYECYIYLNNNYIYIYNYNETQADIYWYGYGPTEYDNNLLLFNVDLYSLSGWNNDLNFLFSEENNFSGEPPTYEDGYRQGYENGYSSGVNNVTSNPNNYNLYTYNQYQGNYTNGYNAGEEDGYNRGYLDGLDDGADTNISFQYINAVLDLVGNFLNIEILPGIKLSYALGIIIILTIISIIKMVVK